MSIQSAVFCGPRQVENGVEPGPDVAGLGALVTGSFKLADFAQRRLTYVVRQLGLLDSRSIILGTLGLALGELLPSVRRRGGCRRTDYR
jgi:hypothetical protein